MELKKALEFLLEKYGFNIIVRTKQDPDFLNRQTFNELHRLGLIKKYGNKDILAPEAPDAVKNLDVWISRRNKELNGDKKLAVIRFLKLISENKLLVGLILLIITIITNYFLSTD